MAENLKEFINKKISKIHSTNLPINLFFLKYTSSINPENFFEIKRVTLREEADDHFKKLLLDDLTNLSTYMNENTIGDFFNEVNNNMSIIPISQIDRLLGFIKKIKQFDSIPEVYNEQAVKKINVHAYKIELDDNSEIIFFTKIPSGGRIKSKTAFLKDGYFNIIKDALLIYEDRVDCVYFSDYDQLVVLDKPMMETIFKFDEFYKQKTKNVYDNKLQNKLIKAPDNLLESIQASPLITKKVTRMEKDNKFDVSSDELQKHMESLEENKDRFTEQFKSYRSLQQENGLYVTENKDEFKIFLNACDKSVEIPLEQKDENEPDIYLNPSPIKMTA